MKPIPIAQYLNRFERVGAAGFAEAPRQPPALMKPRVAATTVEDIEARLHEAFERGRQEGFAAARAEGEAALARHDGELDQRLQAERVAFQAEGYAKLADHISAGLAEIEARIADGVAHILRPYLSQEQSKRVIQALSETLGRILSSESAALLKISGPEAVLNALRDRLSKHAVEVEYVLEEGVDVTIEAQQTVIRSQLQGWLDLIDSTAD